LLTCTYAAGYYADHWVALVAPEYLVKVRARSVVIAQGAYEQPAVFRGNDLPGVMLASAAQRLLYDTPSRARSACGSDCQRRGLCGRARCAQRGAGIGRGARSARHTGSALDARGGGADAARVALHYGVTPVEALARAGGDVGGLLFETTAGAAPRRRRIGLDGIWMSVGFAPANALLHQAGARLAYSQAAEQFLPQTLPSGCMPAARSTACIHSPSGCRRARRGAGGGPAWVRRRGGAPPVGRAA